MSARKGQKFNLTPEQRRAKSLIANKQWASDGVWANRKPAEGTPKNTARCNSTPYLKWRRAVLSRDNSQCRMCGSNIRVEACHRVPWLIAKHIPALAYSLDNGISLCFLCHAFFDPSRAQFLTTDEKQTLERYDKIVMFDKSVLPYRPIFVEDWPEYCKQKAA